MNMPKYSETVPLTSLSSLASVLGLKPDDYQEVCRIAGLVPPLDFDPVYTGTELSLTSSASARLALFDRAARKCWPVLASQIRLWKRIKLGIVIQSLLRSHLSQRRSERVSEAADLLTGLVSITRAISDFASKRRAAVRIQSHYRMYALHKDFSTKMAEWKDRKAATRIQCLWRARKSMAILRKLRAVNEVAEAINSMQKCVRSVLASDILYLSAIRRRQVKSTNMVRGAWLGFRAREQLKRMQGFKVLAVHAKFICSHLRAVQICIARHWRGYQSRKVHAKVCEDLYEFKRMRFAIKVAQSSATSIQAFWRGSAVRKQFLVLRRLAIILQACIKTNLAVKYYRGFIMN